ncbi:hypothetical protein QF046_003154 [Microbacterium sp. W4I4]|nr:hypothetical protein [Microbacterium sp. W4I4]
MTTGGLLAEISRMHDPEVETQTHLHHPGLRIPARLSTTME